MDKINDEVTPYYSCNQKLLHLYILLLVTTGSVFMALCFQIVSLYAAEFMHTSKTITLEVQFSLGKII